MVGDVRCKGLTKVGWQGEGEGGSRERVRVVVDGSSLGSVAIANLICPWMMTFVSPGEGEGVGWGGLAGGREMPSQQVAGMAKTSKEPEQSQKTTYKTTAYSFPCMSDDN